MNYTQVKKGLLKLVVVLLLMTALAAILVVLDGGDDGTMGKALASNVLISAGGLCSFAGIALIEKRGQKWVGITGIWTSCIAVALSLVAMWCEIEAEPYLKTLAVFAIVAVALAYRCLLRLPNLPGNFRWVQASSDILIGLFTLQLIILILWEIGSDTYGRSMMIVGILVALNSLAIPICRSLGGKGEPSRPRSDFAPDQQDGLGNLLSLRKLSGDVYEDGTGRRFQVIQVESNRGSPE